MRYLSTRGNSPTQSFCDILLGGLAPDGGLYLPESYPQVTRAELDAWRTLSYAELAFAILSKFIDDIPAADLKSICDKTYTAEVYCNARAGDNAAEITPVHWLEKENGKGKLGLLEVLLERPVVERQAPPLAVEGLLEVTVLPGVDRDIVVVDRFAHEPLEGRRAVPVRRSLARG